MSMMHFYNEHAYTCAGKETSPTPNVKSPKYNINQMIALQFIIDKMIA